MEKKYELADIGEGKQEVEMSSTLPPVVPRLKMKDKVDDVERSSMVVLNVQELEMSMSTSLRNMGVRVKKTQPWIYTVFPPARKQHEEDYDPKIIGIGPFHHDKKALKAMEPLKWRYLRQLIYRNIENKESKENKKKKEKKTLQNYINVIGDVITVARGYYSEQIELDDNEFVEMMVLDGGFLIEYLVKAYLGENERYPSEGNWNLPLLRRDLLLLENQIPFLILQLLFDSSFIPELLGLKMDGNPVTLTELAVAYFTLNKFESLPEETRPETILHLLHLYHAFIHPTPQRDDQLARSCCVYAMVSTMKRMKSLASAPFLWLLSVSLNCHVPLNCCGSCRRRSKEKKSRAPRVIPTATELQESGVQFMKRKKDTGSFLDVRFDKAAGTMEIPMIPIREATIFRNLIAFEQCCPKAGSHFTSHAILMNNLIDTPMDVAILKDAHIILGEDKEVVELFSSLCMGAYLDYNKHHNRQLFEDVVAYTDMAYSNIDRDQWRAVREYFSIPWAILSLFAAVVLLLLTFLQTFFAIYAYKYPPPNGN